MSRLRQAVVNLVRSWQGKNEADKSFRSIIDTYNSYEGTLPRKLKMKYDWEWCACTWSALAVELGYTDIMPIEISCGNLIKLAQQMGCWQENDGFVPKPGDAILYDWGDKGKGDNTAWPDHIGTVIEVHEDAGYFVVMEGNYNGAVKPRTMSINGKYIRGFIAPKYDDDAVPAPVRTPGKDLTTIAREVIAGTWGSGEARKKALTAAGYNYSSVQAKVNQLLNGTTAKPAQPAQTGSKKVTATCAAKKFDENLAGTYKTTTALNCRNDAGANKKSLCAIPANTQVKCFGYYNTYNGVKWLYIQFTLNGIQYTGFSNIKYLKK